MNVLDTWFLVADRSRVRVLRGRPDGRLDTVHDFDAPAVREHARELMTGRRGRRADSAGRSGPRSAMERQTSVQDTEVQSFVQDLVDWLHTAATRDAFEHLLVIAAPQMLGELRQHLTPPVSQRLEGTLSKDYTSLAPRELAEVLHAHFPEHLPERVAHVPEAARRGNQQPPR